MEPSSRGRSLRAGPDGRAVATDGPYLDTVEGIGGFYLLEAADLDAAVALAAQIPGAWTGLVEVRPVIDFSARRAEQAEQAGQ